VVYQFKDTANTVLPLSLILNVKCLGRFVIMQVMYIQNLITNETLIYESEEKAKRDLAKFFSEWKEALKIAKEQEKIVGFTQIPASHLPDGYDYEE